MNKLILLIFILLSPLDIKWLTPDSYSQSIETRRIVIIEFWAPWSANTALTDADIQQVEEFANHFRLNIEKYPELAEKYELTSIPEYVIYVNGEATRRLKADISFKEPVPLEKILCELKSL